MGQRQIHESETQHACLQLTQQLPQLSLLPVTTFFVAGSLDSLIITISPRLAAVIRRPEDKFAKSTSLDGLASSIVSCLRAFFLLTAVDAGAVAPVPRLPDGLDRPAALPTLDLRPPAAGAGLTEDCPLSGTNPGDENGSDAAGLHEARVSRSVCRAAAGDSLAAAVSLFFGGFFATARV